MSFYTHYLTNLCMKCDGLVDTLSHNLKVNFTEVYATVPILANCSLMYWNAHGEFMHHQILSNIVQKKPSTKAIPFFKTIVITLFSLCK